MVRLVVAVGVGVFSEDVLQVPLPMHLEQLIKGIPVAQITRLPDSFVWPHNNGICLVKSALKYLYQQA